MRVLRLHGAKDLRLHDEPRRWPGPGEVLVRVAATSVNPFDCAVRAGYMTGWYNYPLPHIPGLDVSGVVAEVGEGVKQFAAGDEVYARTDPVISLEGIGVRAVPPVVTGDALSRLAIIDDSPPEEGFDVADSVIVEIEVFQLIQR